MIPDSLRIFQKFRENSVDDRREGCFLLIYNALQFRHLTIGDERHNSVASRYLRIQGWSTHMLFLPDARRLHHIEYVYNSDFF